MGIETPLEKAFDFIYNSKFENGLTEYEFDHVFVGYYDGDVDVEDVVLDTDHPFKIFQTGNFHEYAEVRIVKSLASCLDQIYEITQNVNCKKVLRK